MLEIFSFILVFCLALGTSLIMMPLAIHLSHRFEIFSIPGGRRQEAQPMPKLGGLAIFCGFIIAIIFAQYLPVPRFDPYEAIRLAGLMIGSIIIFLLGIIDDVIDLNYFQAFLGQIITAGIAISFQIFIEFFNNPFTGQQTDPWSPVVTITLTMVWLVLMMNTVNVLDGSDGLAGGVAVIAGMILFLNSAFRLEPPQTSVSLIPLALSGASLGFLIYNFFQPKFILAEAHGFSDLS